VRHLALLARAPSAGGKTRLTGELTEGCARSLREALFLDTLDAARSLHIPITVFGTPADRLEELRVLAGGVVALAQPEGDLGRRMHAACAWLFGDGARSVVVIGSDLPSLPSSHISAAFDSLDAGADLVIGPAEDGGYYLIGMSRPRPAVFDGVAWGSASVLEATHAAAASAGLRVHEIAPWYDVDTAADLARVASGPEPARYTRQWMAASPE
jgi:uncharacterized protein